MTRDKKEKHVKPLNPYKRIVVNFADNGYVVVMAEETRVSMTREGALEHVRDFMELSDALTSASEEGDSDILGK